MSQNTTLDALTHRLDRLEWQHRRLKLAGFILLLTLIALGAMGQMIPRAVPKVVEAERFVLRDTTGKILAALGTEASGILALSLADQTGKVRARLGVQADGGPVLALVDQNGKPRIGLGVAADGAPGLLLSDQNGKVRLELNVLADGTPGLGLVDQNGKDRFLLSVGFLRLFDKDGKVIWRAP